MKFDRKINSPSFLRNPQQEDIVFFFIVTEKQNNLLYSIKLSYNLSVINNRTF